MDYEKEGHAVMEIIIQKHREFYIETHLAVIGYKKAFDNVNRNKLI
jgi:hypothetical protein